MAAPSTNPVITSDPAAQFAAVTPSDSTNLTATARALYVGGGGNVAIVGTDPNATAVTFVGVLAGTILPTRCIRVNSTNTTATNIVALY